jgi:hypothetical protein
VNRPALVLEVVGHLEHALVVVDAHHLLEERGVAPGERDGRLDERALLRVAATRRQQVFHHRRGVVVAQSRELDDRVTVAPEAPPALARRQHVLARGAEEHDRPLQALDERREEVERVVLRPVQVVEREHQGPVALDSVGLEECLDDGAAHRPHRLGVALDGLDERRVLEPEVEQLAEEIRDVPHLAVVVHGSDLVAQPRLGRLGVHSVDQPEARPEEAREHFVSRPSLARRAPVDPRGTGIVAKGEQEVANEPGLAHPVGADHRDGLRALFVAGPGKSPGEQVELRATPRQRGPSVDDRRTGGRKEAGQSHGGQDTA